MLIVGFLLACAFVGFYWAASNLCYASTLKLAERRLYLHLAAMVCLAAELGIYIHLAFTMSLFLLFPALVPAAGLVLLFMELFKIMDRIESLDGNPVI